MELRICKPGEAPRLRLTPPEGMKLNDVWVQGSVNIGIKHRAGWRLVPHLHNRALPEHVQLFTSEGATLSEAEPMEQVGTVTIDGTKNKGKRQRIHNR
jgi:hypothetical protein